MFFDIFLSNSGVLVRYCSCGVCMCVLFFFFQAEDGIRDLVRSRGLGDVYKRQHQAVSHGLLRAEVVIAVEIGCDALGRLAGVVGQDLSLIHI